jgi:hypothetical protein
MKHQPQWRCPHRGGRGLRGRRLIWRGERVGSDQRLRLGATCCGELGAIGGSLPKAKWEGNELKVTSTQDNVTSTERFHQSGDGTLMLVVERPGHRTITLFFERQ